MDELLTPNETARMLNISLRTLSRYREEERLPYVQYSSRCFRYPRRSIEEFIRSRYTDPRQ